jgi:hypothetical protein
METNKDLTILRDLVKKYMEICGRDSQEELRRLWRDHNSLKKTRPLILVGFPPGEIPDCTPKCEDPFYRQYESHFLNQLYHDKIGDDHIFKPWITIRASFSHGGWGIGARWIRPEERGGAARFDNPLKTLDDISKMVKPKHAINEADTKLRADRLKDAIGDLIEIDVDRGPAYRVWSADLSTDLMYLRGLNQMMLDMSDNPEWLHSLLKFMMEGVLSAHEEAEKAGDWSLTSQENQAETYAHELADPKPNSGSVKRKDIWAFFAAQEFAQVGPEMQNEFLFQYQFPIMEKFGLVAYGCCEDLTHKIKYLKKLPNMRRIGVTPWADIRKCAEQIGQDYVISWRPNPSDMICVGFDPDHIREVVKDAMEACKGCHVDITLKDTQTYQNESDRGIKWLRIVREITDNY